MKYLRSQTKTTVKRSRKGNDVEDERFSVTPEKIFTFSYLNFAIINYIMISFFNASILLFLVPRLERDSTTNKRWKLDLFFILPFFPCFFFLTTSGWNKQKQKCFKLIYLFMSLKFLFTVCYHIKLKLIWRLKILNLNSRFMSKLFPPLFGILFKFRWFTFSLDI